MFFVLSLFTTKQNMQILKLKIFLCECFILTLSNCYAKRTQHPPHIIIILADDMGWSDVSFHGSNLFLTPNIDALAYNGVVLHDFHTSSLCTPSRAALMTGKFPLKIGMQQLLILEAEPWGLPLELKIIPQYLENTGYRRHLVGKWHLGFFKKEYTPILRGFESFFGLYQGHHDYFTHEAKETFNLDNFAFVGHDLNENFDPQKRLQGKYSSDLFNEKSVDIIKKHDPSQPLFLLLAHLAPHAGERKTPLQAPVEVTERFAYIADEKKRKYAAMVSKLDEGVGMVMNALSVKNMLENSVIMFVSDNGAPTIGIYSTTGSNYPFRGIKQTEFEGGTRVPAVIWSPLLINQQRVSNMMMHMVDILPTLCTAAGIKENLENIDGISMWETLMKGSDNSPRTEYPYNMNGVRDGEWKYYQGDWKKFTTNYKWPGNKYKNSDYNGYTYDTSKILQSATNIAIEKAYKQINDSVARKRLTAETILLLRSQMTITCRKIEDLPKCSASKSCLINLKTDPCENYDWAGRETDMYENMKRKFNEYRKQAVKALNKPRDVCANPKYYGGDWVPWKDDELKGKCKANFVSSTLQSIVNNTIDPAFRYFAG